jgi:capsular exopolysaccharide synthesis family protein
MGDFVEIRQYITIILKRWWVMVLVLIITIAAGYLFTTRQQPAYRAKASILVGQSYRAVDITRSEMQVSEQLAQTYAAIAQRQPVLQGTAEALGLEYGWQRLKGQVSANLVPETQLVEITVEAASPEEAKRIADEVAQQLILLSPTSLQNQEFAETIEFVKGQLAVLQDQIRDGQARLEELDATDLTALTAEEALQLQRDAEALQTLLADWENKYVQMLSFVDGKQSANYLAVIETAQANSKPVRPNVTLNMSVAAVIGLALGLTIIFVWEHLDDSIKFTDDLDRLIGVSPLGTVGEFNAEYYSNALITAKTEFSPGSEDYRMVRSNIQFMSVNGTNKNAILVTSSVRGEGKSITAANLGVVMAQAGHKTIVVDADLRRPVQHEIFQVSNERGLTDFFRESDVTISDFLMDTQVPDLQVLCSGVLPPNPSELLGSQRMKQIMASLSEFADVVIYDSPPAALVADPAIVAAGVDGVVLLIEVGKTHRDAIKQAVFNLRQAEANIFGAVLNRVSKKRYGYYYRSSYDSHEPSVVGYLKQLNLVSLLERRKWLPFVNR